MNCNTQVFELVSGHNDTEVFLKPMYTFDVTDFDDPKYEGKEYVVLDVFYPHSAKDIRYD